MQTLKGKIPYWRSGLTGLIIMVLALLHSLWQLTLHGEGGNSLILPASAEKIPIKVESSASGNIFTLGRLKSEAEAERTNSEPEISSNESKLTYQLVSIIRNGNKSRAVFMAEKQRIVLSIGESEPQLGQVQQIEGRQVTTIDSEGTLQQWQIFNSQALEQSTSDTQE